MTTRKAHVIDYMELFCSVRDVSPSQNWWSVSARVPFGRFISGKYSHHRHVLDTWTHRRIPADAQGCLGEGPWTTFKTKLRRTLAGLHM
jgi:hypothetical protein